ncbi:DUF2332 domain-containing protein [Jatrophihabitans fulvus]
MPDWIGGDGRSTSETYRRMALDQFAGVSASYEVLGLGISDDAGLCALIDTLPRSKRQPNLVLGAVRYLGGPVGDYAAFRAFVRESWADVEQVVLTHATQTNEPHRCATLLPQLATIDGPVALLEVGTSAGLCLYPDRYGYDYGGTRLGDGPPVFSCDLVGAAAPARLPDVVWRAGLDLNPLDVSSDEDVRWLEALIWPEHTHRFETLAQAVAVARADPPRIVRGDLTRDLTALADEAPDDATLVVFHTAVLAYVPDDARTSFVDAVRDLAARRPTVWLANEGRGVVPGTADVETAHHEFVLSRDGHPVALTAPHGGSYRTLAAPTSGW